MLVSVAVPELGGVLLILLVVVFGGSQLPKIAKNVGSAGREFRKAQREAEEEDAAAAKKAEAAAPPAVTAGPVVTPTVAATVPAPAPVVAATPVPAAAVPDDDKITISKSELAALLDERLGRGETSGHTN